MTRAFIRSWRIDVGNTRIQHATDGQELSVKFNVKKSLEREPNTAEIRIANLRSDRRRQLEQADSPQISLRAGYVDLEDVIFAGDARDIWSEKDGTEVWTVVEAEDGGRAYRTAEYEGNFGVNVSVVTVFRALANAMNVGIGNAESIFRSASLDNGSSIIPQGMTLSGPAWRSMDMLCRSCSLRWSVQNGVLQLRRNGMPAETRAIRLSATSGLVGSPTRGKKDERTNKATYSARALLFPGLYPGRVVVLQSDILDGSFLANRVEYTGDSFGTDWYADIELEDY